MVRFDVAVTLAVISFSLSNTVRPAGTYGVSVDAA
jgi:hypothetical protein